MDEERPTVGARNPFALAELRLKKPVSWKAMAPGQRRKILEDACECEFARMFEPSSATPVFALPEEARRWVK